jgi:hypothetical protein
VKLVAYDLWGEASAERDQHSADFIRRIRETKESAAYWTVFGGKEHARNTKDYQPVGFRIQDWGLIHLNANTAAARAGDAPDPLSTIAKPLLLGPVAPPLARHIRSSGCNPPTAQSMASTMSVD